MMNLRISRKTLTFTIEYIVVMLFLVIYGETVGYSAYFNKLIAILVLILSILFVYKSWGNVYLLIMSMFIAYSNYSIVVGIYLDETLRPIYLYPQITDNQIYGIGVVVLFLYMFTLIALLPKITRKNDTNLSVEFIKKENKNQILFLIFLCGFVFITITGYTINVGSRGSTSPIYEYASILLIMMFYYSGNTIINRSLCFFSTMLYVMTSLIGGTRIEPLICLIIFFLCFFRKGINRTVVFIGMIVGVVLFSVIGEIRGNWMLLNEGIGAIAAAIFKTKFVFNTCTYAYFPSLCMIEMFRGYSLVDAMYYLFNFIVSIFLGTSRVNDSNLIMVTYEKYFHNFGGLSIGFFYVWFSYMGSLIFGSITILYTRIITNKTEKSPYKMCALLYLVATVPRWYLYGPWSMFRGIMICLIVFWGSRKINRLLNRSGK